jgi:hypothetical protein
MYACVCILCRVGALLPEVVVPCPLGVTTGVCGCVRYQQTNCTVAIGRLTDAPENTRKKLVMA